MRNVTSWMFRKVNYFLCVCAIEKKDSLWRCGVKSLCYALQDFVRHFHVLLPEGTIQASQEAIRRYLHQVDLSPKGFQVGRTMV